MNNNLEITWGKPVAQLIDSPDTAYTTRKIYKADVPIEKLGYWHLNKVEHDNILFVQDVTEPQAGIFTIVEEQFEGIPLSDLLAKGIGEKDFQDLIMQLCDVMEFLHNLEPSISHNAISFENILVGKDNLLKLIHFDDATLEGSLLDDIATLGILMRNVDAKYIKKYQPVIDSCIGREYKTVDSLRQDFYPSSRIPKILFVVILIVFAYIIIAGRLL